MNPVRFRFTEEWLKKYDDINGGSFSSMWYTITYIKRGDCYFKDNRNVEDAIDYKNFLDAGYAIFEYEEDIIDKVLIKYQ